MTILEIGAGTCQPLARDIAEDILKFDKFRTCLVRINTNPGDHYSLYE
jgi:hypothetical protein